MRKKSFKLNMKQQEVHIRTHKDYGAQDDQINHT